MQQTIIISSLKELGGLSVFLSWVMCAFYSNVVWPQAGTNWMEVAPFVVSMGASGIAGVVLLVFMGKSRRTCWTWPSWAPWIAGLLCAVGTLLLERGASNSAGETLSVIAASLVTAAGFSLFCLLWGSRVSLMEGARIEVVVPVSLAIAQVLAFGFNATNAIAPEVAAFAALLLPFASSLLYGFWSPETESAEGGASDQPRHLAAGTPIMGAETTRKPIRTAECLAATALFFAFRFWYGAVRSASSQLHPENEIHFALRFVLTVLVFALFLFAALFLARSVNTALAVAWLLPVTLWTLAFMHWNGDAGHSFVQIANNILSPCSQAFFYILFAKAAQRNLWNGVVMFACFLSGLSLGNSLGIAWGTWAAATLPLDTVLLFMTALAATIATTCFPLMRASRFLGTQPRRVEPSLASIPASLDGDGPIGSLSDTISEDADRAAESLWTRKAAQLARRYGLSAREQEILVYLLMGRNRPYIRDTLYISINTVNTHAKRIYAKAGVHSQQELIDLAYKAE